MAQSSSKAKLKLCSCVGRSGKCPNSKREKGSVECGSESATTHRARGSKKAK